MNHIMLSEKIQTQKISGYVIPFIWHTKNRYQYIHPDGKQIDGCQGL